jgi:hypothetical protein
MRIQDRIRFIAIRLTIAIILIGAHRAAMAADVESRAGHGRVTTSYQYVRGDGYKSRIGTFDTFTTDSHALDVEVEYNLTDRWTITAGIPVVMKRIKATPEEQALHDPALIVPPQDSKFIDDGKYHTSLQDFRLGVRYLAVTSPVIIEPFVEAGTPSNDYVFFSGALAGQHLWRVALGASFTYVPPLSDYYLRLSTAYVVVEETLGVSINHWRFSGEVGYRLKSNLTGRLFFIGKNGRGLTSKDFASVTDINWYHHDQTIIHDYVNAGAAIDWYLGPRIQLTFVAHKGIYHDEMTKVPYAFGLGLTRFF